MTHLGCPVLQERLKNKKSITTYDKDNSTKPTAQCLFMNIKTPSSVSNKGSVEGRCTLGQRKTFVLKELQVRLTMIFDLCHPQQLNPRLTRLEVCIILIDVSDKHLKLLQTSVMDLSVRKM